MVARVVRKNYKKITGLFFDFFESEKTSGVLLIVCTVFSILMANSSGRSLYIGTWHYEILGHSLQYWINDGLMAIFFLLIGLEIEREIYVGELSNRQNALLPIAAAIGGMATPALFHFLLNRETATVHGAGIPMATDIAFALGILSLVGNKVPTSLKVFLAALAIIDDLGAIIVIAVFYVTDFSLIYFTLALAIFGLLLLLNRCNINRLSVYLILGGIMWFFMLKSGVHATIAGVLLAFAIPFRQIRNNSPSYRLQHFLHKPVAFFIMPIFALANTGITLTGNWAEGLATSNSLGIIAGLLGGKPLGIFLFSYLSVKAGLSKLPNRVGWKHIISVGFLGGIGFTMSIFITLLAFGDSTVVESSKLSILLTSVLSGTIGFMLLSRQST
ncbi:Na+/H+ antiporter NhaA type [Citrifermentans bremense]|uniref:Na(+)/H(+) antiporter NhaA n=1 Tax=Citrifermentans bremense TaxID=60035 RepID=A0A7R7FT98_9BACT|nr:Na+/H+ antiporter NhaA [Citrifermentans bremense]BCO11287.1 Na+/H+ antiporter NhaA type [Citrifermentans bremense]